MIKISIAFFIFCFSLTLGWSLLFNHDNSYALVCELVAEKIYLPREKVIPWEKACLARAALVKPWTSRDLALKDLKNFLQNLHVSHLEIYQPVEVKEIWSGVHLETGIESEFVDSELVIFKVHPGSAAEKAGLKYGDVIVSLNGDQPNPWELSNGPCEVVYRRAGAEKKITLGNSEVQRDERIEFHELAPKTWQIRVHSFRREFFENPDWITPQSAFLNAKKIIIDLRGNRGGNFVAAMRLMAPFLCKPTDVGYLDKADQEEKAQTNYLPDSLDEKIQLQVLQRPAGVKLRTPESKICLHPSSIKVLVDGKTASVAEMVAQGLSDKAGAEIMGTQSAGQMLVGVWYPLPEFGKGVEISIPEATFHSALGLILEGPGVTTKQTLHYDLHEMEKGLDSWLERAKR